MPRKVLASPALLSCTHKTLYLKQEFVILLCLPCPAYEALAGMGMWMGELWGAAVCKASQWRWQWAEGEWGKALLTPGFPICGVTLAVLWTLRGPGRVL